MFLYTTCFCGIDNTSHRDIIFTQKLFSVFAPHAHTAQHSTLRDICKLITPTTDNLLCLPRCCFVALMCFVIQFFFHSRCQCGGRLLLLLCDVRSVLFCFFFLRFQLVTLQCVTFPYKEHKSCFVCAYHAHFIRLIWLVDYDLPSVFTMAEHNCNKIKRVTVA